eukprot:273176_1
MSNMSNISNNNNNTFAIPKKSLKHIQTDKEKKAITDLINVKREMAKLRQKNRKNEEQLLAEVETYKRRSNDLQNESRKYQCKFKELQNENYEKYTKQFRSLRTQLTEVENQRNQKERELKDYSNKNRMLASKLNKEKKNNETLKHQHKKLYETLKKKDEEIKCTQLERQKSQNTIINTQSTNTSINVTHIEISQTQMNSSNVNVNNMNNINGNVVNTQSYVVNTPNCSGNKDKTSQSLPLQKNGKNARKRKLDDTEKDQNRSQTVQNPKKKIKLSGHNKSVIGGDSIMDLLDDNDNDNDENMVDLITNISMHIPSSYNLYGKDIEFSCKEEIIEYEMGRVTNKLIDVLSGDPLDELGKFIQTLSVSNNMNMNMNNKQMDMQFINEYTNINEQRIKWQNLLNENWFLSKQTKSLIPLIRFLYQILSQLNFNHILPMLNGIKILHIIFDGNDGKLYRKMLFDSITQEKRHKKKHRRKKKKRKCIHNGVFMEQMIDKHGFNHLFCVENNDINDEKDGDNDVEMKNRNKNKKNDKHEMDEDIHEKKERINVKTSLPDIPMVIMELLEIIQNYIFSKGTSKECKTNTTVSHTDEDYDSEMIDNDKKEEDIQKKVRPRVLIYNLEEDLHRIQYDSSILQYHCLFLLYKFLFYSMGYFNKKINIQLSNLILNKFKLIIKILLSKYAILGSKIICIKIIILLFSIENNKPNGISNKISKIFLHKNNLISFGRIDKGSGLDEEPTLLHYCIESLFCISRFDLFEIDTDENGRRNDVLSVYLNIILYQKEIIKLISLLVTKNGIFQEKIIGYSFNFKYCSLKIIDTRVKSKILNTKKSFFYLLSQLIIYLNQIQNDHEIEGMCYQFKNHFIDKKYKHLKKECKDKIFKLIDFAKENVSKDNINDKQSKLDEINREFFKKSNIIPLEQKDNEKNNDKKNEIVLKRNDLNSEKKK